MKKIFSLKNLKYVLGLAIVLTISIFSLIQTKADVKQLVQSDWSGGVESSTDPIDATIPDYNKYQEVHNLDTSTAGELKLPNPLTPPSNWCQMNGCKDATYRQKMTVNNSSSPDPTEKNIRVFVNHQLGMKANFDDIRFTNANSTIEYPYYLINKKDSDVADVLVRITDMPTEAPFNDFDIYLYYGDPSATSQSDFKNLDPIFQDDFETGVIKTDFSQSTDGSYFYPLNQPSSWDNNVPTWNLSIYESMNIGTSSSLADKIQTGKSYLSDMTFKYTINQKSPLYQSSYGYPIYLGSIVHSTQSDFWYNNQYHYINAYPRFHNSYSSYHSTFDNPLYDQIDPTVYLSTLECSQQTNWNRRANNIKELGHQDQFINSVILSTAASGYDYGDCDGTQRYWVNPENSFMVKDYYNTTITSGRCRTNNDYRNVLYFNGTQNNSSNSMTIKHIRLFNVNNISLSIGTTEQVTGLHGVLTSSVFDLGESPFLSNADKLTFNSTNNDFIWLKIRSAKSLADLNSNVWGECNSLPNNSSPLSSNCVQATDRYLQYQLYLIPSSIQEAQTFKLNSLTLPYSNDTDAPNKVTNITIRQLVENRIISELKTENNEEIKKEGIFTYGYIPDEKEDEFGGGGYKNRHLEFQWGETTDETNGSGIKGYCLYLGTDKNPDLRTTNGILKNNHSTEDCAYFTTDTTVNLADIYTSKYDSVFGCDNNHYNLYIQALDYAGNFSPTSSLSFLYLYGNSVLGGNIYDFQENPRSTVEETISWKVATLATSGQNTDSYGNSDGGFSLGFGSAGNRAPFLGLKYCVEDFIGSMMNGNNFFELCDPEEHPENWTGPAKKDYYEDYDAWVHDVYDYSKGTLTTHSDDSRYLENILHDTFGVGLTITAVLPVTEAGVTANYNMIELSYPIRMSIYNTKMWSDIPKNLTGAPSDNDQVQNQLNNFSFNWEAPEAKDSIFYDMFYNLVYMLSGGGSDDPDDQEFAHANAKNMDFFTELFIGTKDKARYCWSVNEPFAFDNEGKVVIDPATKLPPNCNLTAVGQTSLPAGAYAKEQGENTLYVMTVNQAGQFSPYNYEMGADSGNPLAPNLSIPSVANNVATIKFYANTLNPDTPEDFGVTDISSRDDDPAKSVLQLALTWKAPVTGAEFVDKYIIDRSEDGGDTWTEDFASTSKTNLSFIDSGLEEKDYSYRIKACDSAKACSDPTDVITEKPVGYFTSPPAFTAGTTPQVSSIGTRKATVTWQTDRVGDSRIKFGLASGDYFEQEVGNSDRVTNHSVKLDNLQPGTTYYYVVETTDTKSCKGNCTSTSLEQSFTTLPAPIFSEVEVNDITIDSANVNFTSQYSHQANLLYGMSEGFGGLASINTSPNKSSYAMPLRNLTDGQKYFIKLNGFDEDGYEYSGNVYSFNTMTRPRISNLRFQPVVDEASNTTKVTWLTNVPTNSSLTYGVVGGQTQEAVDAKLVVEHEMIISGLDDDSNYSLVARSRDASDNLAISDTHTFRTALDTRPPKISKVTVETAIRGKGAEAKGQVIVTWQTDEPSTSQIAFGQGAPGNYNNKTVESSDLSTEHTVVISDLSTSSIYQIQPISKDKAGNEGKGSNQSAIVGRGFEDVFTIIFNSLRNIFGIGAR